MIPYAYSSASNLNIKNKVAKIISTGGVFQSTMCESDGVIFNLKHTDNVLTLDLNCQGGPQIRDNGGAEIMKQKHGEHYVEDHKDSDCRLRFDTSALPVPSKPSKKMSAEEKDAIHEENAKIKTEREQVGEEIGKAWSFIKRDFMGAPVLRALTALKEGK